MSIQEASRRLRISTASVRECIRAGELKAERAPGPHGRTSWVVEMPEEGWTSSAVSEELDRAFTPWWWGNKEKTGKVHPIGRMGRPSDIADAVLFLASEKASFITGSYLNVDGGLMSLGAWGSTVGASGSK